MDDGNGYAMVGPRVGCTRTVLMWLSFSFGTFADHIRLEVTMIADGTRTRGREVLWTVAQQQGSSQEHHRPMHVRRCADHLQAICTVFNACTGSCFLCAAIGRTPTLHLAD
jgi:hypothetical protein